MSTPEKWKEQDGAEGAYQKSVFETLFFGYRPYLKKIIFVCVIGLVGRALLLGNANVIGIWVDSRCEPPAPCHEIPAWAQSFADGDFLWLLSIMAVVGFLMTFLFRVVFSRLSAQAVSQIYDEVTLRTSRFPMVFFDTTPAGRVITRFSSDYGNVFRLFGGPLAEFLSILFDLTMMVVLMTLAHPFSLLLVGLIAALNYVVYRLNRTRLRRLRRELSRSRSPSIAHFAETTQGASTIRSFRREGAFRSRFDRLDSHFIDRKLETTWGLVFFSFQMNSLSALLLLLTGVTAVGLIQAGHVSVGSVGVAFAFIAMSGNTVQMFFEWLAQLEEALIGVERLDRYLRSPLEPGHPLPSRARFPTPHARENSEEERRKTHERLTRTRAASVEIEDLWFRYQEHLPWVLKGVSFQVAPGERIGIIGRTGSGKSSLIQALFRLYPIDKGHVRIDRREAHVGPGQGDVDLSLYRRALAFIAQEPVLFQGRLRDNLDIDGQASDDDMFEALDRVGLGDWAKQHPLGLDLPIEERGKNLSLGERQLLCMARCLMQDAPVVVMDEATSSVDPQSEEILVKATDEIFRGRTQILIAHRLSTLQNCDKILWLDSGQVRRWGPASEVLAEFEASALQSSASSSEIK